MLWPSFQQLPACLFYGNPFFIRELRQHARRRATVQAWVAAFATLLALPVCWPVLLLAMGGDRPGMGGTLAIQVIHFFLCLSAGGYGGHRVYDAEKHRHTLESVLLLPHPPVSWLWQKSVPALLLGATCVGLAFPIYLAAIILGMERMEVLPRVMAQAAVAVCGGMGLSLLFPPRADPPPAVPTESARPVGRDVWLEGSKLLLVILVPGVMVLATLGRVLGPRTWIPFYMGRAPLWPLLFTLAGAGLAATALTAATPIGPEAWERRAVRFRLAVCALAYYAGAGVLWQRLPLPASLLLLVLPWVAVAISDRFRPRRRTDPWIEGDLRRVARWSENPVLLLDYRIHSRHVSLLRGFASGLLTGLVIILVIRLIQGTWTATLRALVSGGGFSLWLAIFNSVGGVAATMWQKEAAANALPSLLLSPLSSREIVKGRLGAASIRTFSTPAGLFVPAVAVLIIVAPAVAWKVVAGVVAMLPILVSTNLCSGFSFSEKGMPRPPLSGGEKVCYWGVWLLHVLGVVCCFLAIALGIFGKLLALTPAGIGFLLHAAAAKWMFELKVRRLESVRTADFIGLE